MLKYTVNKWMMGRVSFRAEGLRPEKLLATAEKNGIVLEQVRRVSDIALEAVTSRTDFRKLQKVLPTHMFAVTVRRRKGPAFTAGRLKMRPVLTLGMIAAIVAMAILSRYVWVVRIYGTSNTELVRKTILQAGIRQVNGEKLTQMEDAVMALDPNILWTSVEKDGIYLDVFVKEKDVPKEQPSTAVGDVIAAKDCVIRTISVTKGTAMVKEGQTVQKGDVLIQGKAVYGGVEYPVAAEGIIQASVWYYDSVDIPATETVYVRTGRSAVLRYLDFAGLTVPLSGKNNFTYYETETDKAVTGSLPFGMRQETVFELQAKEKQTDLEASGAKALEKMRQGLMDQIADADVEEENTWTESSDDGYSRVCIYLETIENIGENAWK